jgi:SAM-dependent methyltransferase
MQASIDWHSRFTQQARWTASLRRHLFERLGLDQSRSILEVGCGTGAILQELASRPEAGLVSGLDLNPNFLSQASLHAPSALLVQGDAHRLPYASASFDAVLCHFLLLWVAEPAVVLAEMARLIRPGGSLMALAEPDYGGRIDYPEALAQLGQWQEAALQSQGADTRLGRRLGALFTAAGLVEVQVGLLGGEWRLGDQTGWESEWAVLEDDLHDQIDPLELARLHHIEAQARQNGQRLLFVPTFWAWGKVA